MNELFTLYDAHGRVASVDGSTAVTIGMFDGVHLGHRHLLSQLSSAYSPLVVTLTAHPSFVLGRRESEYWLDDPDEHLRLLFTAGARYVAVMPFTRQVAQLTACETADLVAKSFNMKMLLLGYDGRFGNRERDDFPLLWQKAEAEGFGIVNGTPFLIDGSPISSSRIREALLQGDMEEVSHLLGRCYSVSGTVIHGRGVGHTMGFPTDNIDLTATRKMLPREGDYVVDVKGEGLMVRGMANLGAIPTFDIDKASLEVHLIDYDGNLYGQSVEVQFLHRLRDVVRFDSAEALEEQLKKDLKDCRRYE